MVRSVSLAIVCCSLLGCGSEPPPPAEPEARFQPNWESLRTHEVPEWFEDAKLGIFVHWGLYSVPAWATPLGELGQVDWDQWFRSNPYAEWYLNSLRIEGSPTQEHHFSEFGEDFDYYDFAETFNKEIASWDPNRMAEVFRAAGARYVVLTTKHHDGFTLWPSDVENPERSGRVNHASRDIVGELADAVRARDMRMGLYYSGGLDWTFNPQPIEVLDDLGATVLHQDEYAAYADAHWRELIEKYRPSVLWNDIAYPRQGDLAQIVADYYNEFPDGLINNRFETGDDGDPPRHHDFETPEYAKMDAVTDYKWETCRGLGFSFGYNRVEGAEHTIGEAELIRLLVDIVSKNGNLLLNVGPMADGSIPPLQLERLKALGDWLSVNGEAIYGTRPWDRADGKTAEGGDVRFTRGGEALYVILFDRPGGPTTTVNDLTLEAGKTVSVLGAPGEASYESGEDGTTFTLPPLPDAHAYVLKVT